MQVFRSLSDEISNSDKHKPKGIYHREHRERSKNNILKRLGKKFIHFWEMTLHNWNLRMPARAERRLVAEYVLSWRIASELLVTSSSTCDKVILVKITNFIWSFKTLRLCVSSFLFRFIPLNHFSLFNSGLSELGINLLIMILLPFENCECSVKLFQ